MVESVKNRLKQTKEDILGRSAIHNTCSLQNTALEIRNDNFSGWDFLDVALPCFCAVCSLFADTRYTSCDQRHYLVVDSTGFERLEERKTCTMPPLLWFFFWQILRPRFRQFLRKRHLIALAICSKRCQSVANATRMQPKGV